MGRGAPTAEGWRKESMNVKLLIDELIRLTTVMIAQLATTAGIRAPLSHVANQVFLDLVRELEAQGVSKKVAADMFGLALRSYQLKVQRLSESRTDRETSLWEAIFEFVREQGLVTRADVLRRFCYDDVASVKGILNDLVESNLVFQTGKGDAISYRIVDREELDRLVAQDAAESAHWLLWTMIFRRREHGARRQELLELSSLDEAILEGALARLAEEGRVTVQEQPGGGAIYRSQVLVIPMGQASGWEVALFDHINALFTAMGVKLRQAKLRTLPQDVVGGSTYYFDVWQGHPHREEVMSLLRETRAEISALRQRVTSYNDEQGRPEDGMQNVIFYFGQAVVGDDEP